MTKTNYDELGKKMRLFLYGEGIDGKNPNRFDEKIEEEIEKIAERTGEETENEETENNPNEKR